MNRIPNYRVIEVKFLPPTNTLGRRIKLTQPSRGANEKAISKTLDLKYSDKDVQEQAIDYLESIGFNIVGKVHLPNKDLIMVDNWGEDYINLS